MTFRTFGHLLRYGEPAVRRAVPLAIALTSISNPQLHIIDTLSKFSHDSDGEVAYNCKDICRFARIKNFTKNFSNFCNGSGWCRNKQRSFGSNASSISCLLSKGCQRPFHGPISSRFCPFR